MSDHDDPYFDETDYEPAPKGKGKTRASRESHVPGTPDEGDDVDRALAFAPCNDLGNAQRMQMRFGDCLLYVKDIGWFFWDGARWDRERGHAEAVKYAHRIASAIVNEAKALQDKPGKVSPERIDKLFAWSVQTGNTGRVHGMLAAAEPYFLEDGGNLDADPFLIAAPNGTIRIKSTVEFRESEREDRITRVLGARYVPGAECPQWRAFLERIIPDPAMRDFLQEIAGYCLSGSMREHKLFLLYGTGRNGKSTFVNLLREVLGDYGMGSPVDMFLAKSGGNTGGQATPELARLPGARLVTAAEPPEGARLDESRVKEITGGDKMTVRHLNQGFFEFFPQFKAMISTNHRPVIRGTDRGIWSRINLVPFTISIPDAEIDKNLEHKLRAEKEGILQWMLDGAERWFAHGLNAPEAAIAAVEAYRADEDPVGEFLKARCEMCPETIDRSTGRVFEVSAKRLRESYLEWCKEEGLDPLAGKTFGSKLRGRGIPRRKSNGNSFYVGLHLNSDPLPPEYDDYAERR